MPSLRLPGYQLLEVLGGGPLTQVLAARQTATGARCVVKVLREHWSAHQTALELMRREARAGTRVRHPHLVRVLASHLDKSPYFLVMHPVAGTSARQALEPNHGVGRRRAVWVARQVAQAVDALHRSGFIHGDIKPDNICLAKSGAAVLVDLGFAHRPGEMMDLLKRGGLLGTANYLAPELAQGGTIDGTPADVYSLGVTLHELLTGRLPPPAEGDIHHATVEDRCRGSRLGALIARMLATNPARRPRIGAVLAELIRAEINLLRRAA